MCAGCLSFVAISTFLYVYILFWSSVRANKCERPAKWPVNIPYNVVCAWTRLCIKINWIAYCGLRSSCRCLPPINNNLCMIQSLWSAFAAIMNVRVPEFSFPPFEIESIHFSPNFTFRSSHKLSDGTNASLPFATHCRLCHSNAAIVNFVIGTEHELIVLWSARKWYYVRDPYLWLFAEAVSVAVRRCMCNFSLTKNATHVRAIHTR